MSSTSRAATRTFRNLLRLESGTGKAPPVVRTANTDGEQFVLHPDGTLDLVQKPFVVTPGPDGTLNVVINAKNEAELARIISNLAAMMKIPIEELWDQLAKNGTGTWSSRRAGTVPQQLSLGGEDSLRSICKAAFCLIAASFGTEVLRTDAFSSARDFVVSGSAAFNRDRGSLDPRRIPGADFLEDRFGPLFNLIYVRSNSAGRVVAHFTLYNLIAWQAVLAEADGPPDVHLAIVSNPLDPVQWSDAVTPELDVPFEWLDSPDRDDVLPTTRARIARALTLWRDRGQEDAVAHIVNRIFERHGVTDDNEPVLDPELSRRIIAEIADEIAHHMVGVRHDRPMTFEDIYRLRESGTPTSG